MKEDWVASPYWAQNWASLPPILILGADEDVTVDDAVDVAAMAKRAGVEVDLAVWPRMFHCWMCYTEVTNHVCTTSRVLKKLVVLQRGSLTVLQFSFAHAMQRCTGEGQDRGNK